MNEESTVEIKPDKGLESIGHSSYFKGNGKKDRGTRQSLLVSGILMIVIVTALFVTKRINRTSRTGDSEPMAVGNISDTRAQMLREHPELNPKLLTERDLVNVIRPKLRETSLLGKINVLHLGSSQTLPVGSEMKARLESGASDGIVKARLIQPPIVEGEPVLPENSILFGKGTSGPERLMIIFSKVILPTGESFRINAQAFDQGDRILGLKGAVVSRKTKQMAYAMGFGALSGMSGAFQNTSGTSVFGYHRPSNEEAAMAGLAQAASDQSKNYLEEMNKSRDVIEVKSGTEIVVITDEPNQKENTK